MKIPLILKDAASRATWENVKRTAARVAKWPACGKRTRDTTAGCDHCDLEDK